MTPTTTTTTTTRNASPHSPPPNPSSTSVGSLRISPSLVRFHKSPAAFVLVLSVVSAVIFALHPRPSFPFVLEAIFSLSVTLSIFTSLDAIVGFSIASITFVCGVIGCTAFLSWFATSGRSFYVVRRMFRNSFRPTMCAVVVSICGVACFDISWWIKFSIVILITCTSATCVVASWIARLIIARLVILPASMPKALGQYVLPKIDREAYFRRFLSKRFCDKNEREYMWTSVRIPTRDRVSSTFTLHGAVFTAVEKTKPAATAKETTEKISSKSKWIVLFLGNGAHFETALDEATELGLALGRNVLVFNYRGVGSSEGVVFHENDLYRDGRSCLAFLRERYGVTSTKRVLLFGHSLGGAIASEIFCSTADAFEGHLVNDRSFSSLPAVPLSWLSLAKPLRAMPPAFKRWIGIAIVLAMRELKWTMDAGGALLKQATKEKRKRAMVIFHRSDEIIHFELASMHSVVSIDSQVRLLELIKAPVASPHNMSIAMANRWPDFVRVARKMLGGEE